MVRAPLEKHIQRAVLDYLRLRGIVAAHVPNGSVLAGGPRERAMQVNALKSNGMRVGFPDLVLLASGARVGFMEVKREGEKQSEAQLHWQGALEHLGHRYAVVRSVDDAAETLAAWGWDDSARPIGEIIKPIMARLAESLR